MKKVIFLMRNHDFLNFFTYDEGDIFYRYLNALAYLLSINWGDDQRDVKVHYKMFDIPHEKRVNVCNSQFKK